MVRRAVAVALAAVAVSLSLTSTAQAGQAGRTVETYTDEVFVDALPCAPGEWYEITASGRFVEQVTVDKRGVEHFTFTDTGRFTAVPVQVTEWAPHEDHADPVEWEPVEGDSYTGKVTVWGGGKTSPDGVFSGTFTFNVVGTSSSGERLNGHEVFHENQQQPTAEELRANAFGQSNCSGTVTRG